MKTRQDDFSNKIRDLNGEVIGYRRIDIGQKDIQNPLEKFVEDILEIIEGELKAVVDLFFPNGHCTMDFVCGEPKELNTRYIGDDTAPITSARRYFKQRGYDCDYQGEQGDPLLRLILKKSS